MDAAFGLEAPETPLVSRPVESGGGRYTSRTSTNLLLRTLSREDQALLRLASRRVALPAGLVLEEANRPIEQVYFPVSGLFSVIAGRNGTTADASLEVGLLGREGMSGASVVMGDDRTVNETVVQTAGHAVRISAAELRAAMQASPTLRLALLRFAQAFGVQIAQTALVNGRANVEARLARWLLMAHDRADSPTFPVTHKFVALVLGVRRPGVTLAIHFLEGYGLIRATRGLITITDRPGLEARADPSYGIPESEYDRLVKSCRSRK